MLDFFRTYQRIFFFLITFVVVVTFVFFGTYSTTSAPQAHNPVVFYTLTKTPVTSQELNEMVAFLKSDASDSLNAPSLLGGNFLNDGVIRKDFLESGLALEFISALSPHFEKDFAAQARREKHYSPYIHPHNPIISAEAVWSGFAPRLKASYDTLKNSQNLLSRPALAARIEAYLLQEHFPPFLLSQILRYQESQYQWIEPDPDLERTDFSLFGYRNLKDWFGPNFVPAIAQYVINCSSLAEKTYTVSDDEALAELYNNAAQNLSQVSHRPEFANVSPQEFMKEQLRVMNLDISQAKRCCKHILLFRRLLAGMKDAVLVDRESFEGFEDFAARTSDIDFYELPQALKFKTFEQLLLYETYVELLTGALSPIEDLAATVEPKNIDILLKTTPFLVHKSYSIDVAHTSKQELGVNVSLKEVLDWQTKEENWALLEKSFPQLGKITARNESERYEALRALDDTETDAIEEASRSLIVAAHREWIEDALAQATPQRVDLRINLDDSVPCQLVGLGKDAEQKKAFMAALDAKDLQVLAHYSQDEQNFYRISVESVQQSSIVPFSQAADSPKLKSALTSLLKAHFEKHKAVKTDWKDFDVVRSAVAQDRYGNLIKAIISDYKEQTHRTPPQETALADFAAKKRFYALMRRYSHQITGDDDFNQSLKTKNSNGHASEKSFEDQWLPAYRFVSVRRDNSGTIDIDEVFTTQENSWSKVAGDLERLPTFFFVQRDYVADIGIGAKIDIVKGIIADEVGNTECLALLQEMRDTHALALENEAPL